MLDLTLVVIAKNEIDLGRFNSDHVRDALDLRYVINWTGASLASIANQYLGSLPCKVFGLVHADMYFGPGSLQAFYDCAANTESWGLIFRTTGAVCGACGRSLLYRDADVGSGEHPSYVWSKDWGRPTARQLKAGYPANPKGPCPVSTLDSSCIFFPTNLGLRFDENTFDGFHCHGEDICLQAQSKGIPVLVPQANAWHDCKDVNGPTWGAERDVYYRKLKAKWPQLEFVTT